MKKYLLIIALISTGMKLASQCLMYPVLLNQRIPQSSLVVEGKVIDKVSFWNADHSKIFTSNLIDVYRIFKGSSSPFIEVITEGGQVADKMHVVHPTLELNIAEIGVFTLNTSAINAQFGKSVYEPYASAQGFIKYDFKHNSASESFDSYSNLSSNFYTTLTQLTGMPYQLVKPVNLFQQSAGNTTQGVAAITGFSPTTITAGTFSVLTITGSGFGTVSTPSLIAFKNADDGGATTISPLAAHIVTWTPTQIQVRVPSKASTGVINVNGSNSSGILTIIYSHINAVSGVPYITKHVNVSNGGYLWVYNTAFNTNTPAKASFERALNTWRCNTYINWPVSSSTSAISASANDGVNIVTFNGSLGAGVLGNCTSYYSSCGSVVYVEELDIQYSTIPGGGSWQYGPANPTGSQYDFQTVTVHELGHGHQLGHVNLTADFMHYAIGTASQNRNLGTNNLNGALAVMNRNAQAGGTCVFPLMVPLSAGSCSVGSFNAGISSQSTGCISQAFTLNDASTGSPTTWSWSMPGGTPSSAATQNTSVSYATSGAKTISLTATSGTATSTTTQTINVLPPPTLITTPASTIICSGQNTLLKATGATTYSWIPGPWSNPNFLVSPLTTIIYTVIGTSSSCPSAPYTVTVTVNTCTGLEDLESHNDVLIYPNPSNGIITIASNAKTGKLEIVVLNTLGQTVKSEISKDSKETVIDMSSFSKGVYYVKVQMTDGTKLVKLILD